MLQDPERPKEVSDLLGEVESDEFAHLVALGKLARMCEAFRSFC